MAGACDELVDPEDVVNALLAAAVGITHSLGLLDELSAHSMRVGELRALAQIADAVTLLSDARQGLVAEADRLNGLVSGE